MRTTAISSDIFLPLEITAREYAGHLLLATELAERGRTAIIGSKGSVIRVMADAERPGLLFYKNSRLPAWVGTRHAHVGLDPEAGIRYSEFGDFFAHRQVLARDSHSLAQFCFGPDDHAYLTMHFPDLAGRIHLTGAPRVSLWGANGDVFYERHGTKIRERYGDVILFASAGGFKDAPLGPRRNIEETWAVTEYAEHFFKMARAATSLGASVVIRPHPMDNWETWLSMTSEIPGLTVDGAYDLSAWTRVAVAVVHPGTSSAAFEAVCAGTPAISTGSNPTTNVATTLSYVASGSDELLDLLARARARTLPPLPSSEADATLRRKVLHPIENSASRVADILDDVVPFSGGSGLRRSTRARLSSLRRSIARRNIVQRELGSEEPRPYKRDPLVLETVEQDVASCLTILGRTGDVQVRELDENCFSLSL